MYSGSKIIINVLWYYTFHALFLKISIAFYTSTSNLLQRVSQCFPSPSHSNPKNWLEAMGILCPAEIRMSEVSRQNDYDHFQFPIVNLIEKYDRRRIWTNTEQSLLIHFESTIGGKSGPCVRTANRSKDSGQRWNSSFCLDCAWLQISENMSGFLIWLTFFCQILSK